MNTHVPPGDNGTKLMNARILRTSTKARRSAGLTFSARVRDRPPAFFEIVFPTGLLPPVSGKRSPSRLDVLHDESEFAIVSFLLRSFPSSCCLDVVAYACKSVQQIDKKNLRDLTGWQAKTSSILKNKAAGNVCNEKTC